MSTIREEIEILLKKQACVHLRVSAADFPLENQHWGSVQEWVTNFLGKNGEMLKTLLSVRTLDQAMDSPESSEGDFVYLRIGRPGAFEAFHLFYAGRFSTQRGWWRLQALREPPTAAEIAVQHRTAFKYLINVQYCLRMMRINWEDKPQPSQPAGTARPPAPSLCVDVARLWIVRETKRKGSAAASGRKRSKPEPIVRRDAAPSPVNRSDPSDCSMELDVAPLPSQSNGARGQLVTNRRARTPPKSIFLDGAWHELQSLRRENDGLRRQNDELRLHNKQLEEELKQSCDYANWLSQRAEMPEATIQAMIAYLDSPKRAGTPNHVITPDDVQSVEDVLDEPKT